MNAEVKFRARVERMLDEYNLPKKYSLRYLTPSGLPFDRDKERKEIGRYSNDLLAICTALANWCELKKNNPNNLNEIVLNSLYNKLKTQRNNLAKKMHMRVEWSKQTPTYFAIKKYTKIIAIIAL